MRGLRLAGLCALALCAALVALAGGAAKAAADAPAQAASAVGLRDAARTHIAAPCGESALPVRSGADDRP